jgi:cell division septal protein FtsQ
MSERPLRRDTPPRQGNGRGRMVLTVFLLASCVAAIGSAGAGVFTVRRIQVVGQGVPVQAVSRAAGVRGTNVFSVRADSVVARLQSIRTIVVRRVDVSFPDTVTIFAQARVPMVAWRSPSGALYLLDPDGVIISSVQKTDLPIVQGTARGSTLGPGAVAAVRYAVHRLPRAANGAVAGFEYSHASGLTIRGRAGWTAVAGTGSPQTLANRIAVLAALLDSLRGKPRRLKYINLRQRSTYATFVTE